MLNVTNLDATWLDAVDDDDDDGDDDDWQLLLIDVRDRIPVNFDFRYLIDVQHCH